MFITIQFPITDLRYFSLLDTGKLQKPFWPYPNTQNEFVRNFGAVKGRNLGGLSGWIGESYICNANQAIKLLNIHHPLFVEDKKIYFRLIFRRFYFDGCTTGKYEIGLSISMKQRKDDYYLKTNKFSKGIISKIFDHIFNIKVIVPAIKTENNSTSLIKVGVLLSTVYGSVTSNHKYKKENYKDWWINAGQPIIYIEKNNGEEITLPYKIRNQTERLNRAILQYGIIPFHGQDYPFWFIDPISKTSKQDILEQNQFLRTVRILLLRLHAEKESLITVLNNIDKKNINFESDINLSEKTQSYLNEITKKIQTIESHSKKLFDNSDICMFSNTNELINPQFSSNLLFSIEGIRENVLQKIKYFLENNSVIKTIDFSYSANGEIHQETISVNNLIDELIQARNQLEDNPKYRNNSETVKMLSSAEKEIKKGNKEKFLDYLSKVGLLLIETCTKESIPILLPIILNAI